MAHILCPMVRDKRTKSSTPCTAEKKMGPNMSQHMPEAVTCSFTTTVKFGADKVGNWGFCHLPILLKM